MAETGQRVELDHTSDPHTRLRPGTRGTVALVDDAGTTHVDWDDGSNLGMIAAAGDRFHVVPIRRARVRGNVEQEDGVAALLPDNYNVVGWGVADGVRYLTIEGEDVAGWTLEDYVIPRLASGNYFAEEVNDE